MINHATLTKLSEVLSSNKIVWGVGGSFLLQIYGLYANPNDIDIWVRPSDMARVKQLFKNYKEIETNINLPEEYHFKMNYYDLDVDFIACFIIKPNQNIFTYYISPKNIKTIKINEDLDIPCTYLEDWYIIYKLLKRESKAAIIESVFKDKKIQLSDRVLEASLKSAENLMPKKLIKDTHDLILHSTQLSLFDNYDKIEVNCK